MSSQQNIHYFPGHMNRSLLNLKDLLKNIDLVIEISDARAPQSSRNPMLAEMIGDKPELLILSKSDFADPNVTDAWVRYFRSQSLSCASSNLKKDKLLGILSSLSVPLLSKKRQREEKLGMKKQQAHVMVIGVPNVGKSTLINNLLGRNVAIAANRPGVTRAEQWIKLSEDFILLDTPGILPMNYPDGSQAVRLALLGAIKDEVLPETDLCYALLGFLRENYPSSLNARFGISSIKEIDSDAVLDAVAAKRGILIGGRPDHDRAAFLILKEFKDGLLGRLSLELPNA